MMSPSDYGIHAACLKCPAESLPACQAMAWESVFILWCFACERAMPTLYKTLPSAACHLAQISVF